MWAGVIADRIQGDGLVAAAGFELFSESGVQQKCTSNEK